MAFSEGEFTKASVTIGLIALSVALLACAIAARRSKKHIAFDVFLLSIALLAPMVGNLIIILSGEPFGSYIGGYIYYIGMNLTVAALLRFSADYCGVHYRGTVQNKIVLALLALDTVQLLLNPVFGHAFTMQPILVEGSTYYALVPFAGQLFHRIVVYGLFLVSICIFLFRTLTSPSVYLERYLIILIAMVLAGAWETYYIFSGLPVDLSMLGFGGFGLLVFALALHYKPVLLLNGILARVVDDMNDAVLFFDRDRMCIYVNPICEKLFNLAGDGAIENARDKITAIIGEDQFSMTGEWSCRCRVLIEENGTIHNANDAIKVNTDASTEDLLAAARCYWQLNFSTMNDERGRQVGTYLIIHDRTDEELQLRRERHAAEHDPLTGLYNATHLNAVAAMSMLQNPGVPYCVCGIDVREFKLINDIFSKEFGDRVLCAIADRLRACAMPHEVYGRVTGDKFGFVLPASELDDKPIEQLLNLDNFTTEGVTHPIIIHMGVFDVVDEDLPVSVMFDRAFMAIAPIKQDYSRRISHYDESMRETAIWNQKISSELDEALSTEQIRPYLQPMVNDKGVVEGAEVLVRWLHPEEGFLPPVRFIPYFEENGRVAQLDLFMWESACKILSRWQKMGVDFFLSVNISPKDFYFMNVPQTINNLVAKYGVNPKNLRLEITETVVMSDAENRLRIIQDLRSSGFFVEMDDFGSGYSSLNMLKDMPVDLLKIDMMFLYKTKDQRRAQTILQTIVNLSEELGIPSITEGVETAEQLAMLTAMGCRLFQGYYFAKPMPVSEFEEKYCLPAAAGKQVTAEKMPSEKMPAGCKPLFTANNPQ